MLAALQGGENNAYILTDVIEEAGGWTEEVLWLYAFAADDDSLRRLLAAWAETRVSGVEKSVRISPLAPCRPKI